MKNNTGFSDLLVEQVSVYFNESKEETIALLQKPWAISQLLKGKLVVNYKKELHNIQEKRLASVLSLINMMEKSGAPHEWIKNELNNILMKARQFQNK